MKIEKQIKTLLLAAALSLLGACATTPDREQVGPVIDLPFIKNSPSECYYLDEFMPVPDRMIPGKTGSLQLRYYTYNLANYKDWSRKKIILSFYSNDNLCWSLFEEYYVTF
jgi:hypothetical protein